MSIGRSFFLSCLLCVPLCFGVAFAQTQSPITGGNTQMMLARKASSDLEVGVAFLKTVGNFPDFNKIVEETDAYQTMDTLARQDYLSKETQKIQNAYIAFAPKHTSLFVRIDVKTAYHPDPKNGDTLEILNPTGGMIYFPYFFAKYPIALVPKDFELFQNIPLTPNESKLVYANMALDGASTLLLEVYPIAADDKAPVKIDKLLQYPLLSEISYIGLLNTRGEKFWEWKSPKYDRRIGLPNTAGDVAGGVGAIDLIPQKQP